LPSISDDELQKLIEYELRTALRKPELKPIIATTYRDASTAGRQFIETTLTVFDAGFLSELHARSR
jgi:deoxycytidine triphosphate deaminase